MREISLSPPGPPHAALRASLSNAELTSDPLLARSAPAPTRRQRSHRPDRYYVGRRPETTEVYVVSGTELEPLDAPEVRRLLWFVGGQESTAQIVFERIWLA